MKKIINFTALFTVLMGLIIPMQVGHAAEFNFAVNPVIPENQIDKEQSYFDLLMDQGSVQTVEIQLRNDTEQDVVIEPTIASATTNLNGVVEYGKNQIEADETLVYDLADLVEVADEVTIPKGEQINLPLKITMPDEAFDGVIAGGITLKEQSKDETVNTEEDQGLAIKNEFAYVVALLLRQEQKDFSPSLLLTEVAAGQVNARNVINVNFQNPNPTYLNSLYLKHEVFRKGEEEILYSSEKGNMQMAPNTNFSYPISLNGERLEPGDYILKTIAYAFKAEDGEFTVLNQQDEEANYQNMWEFEKEFTVSGEVARDLNKKDVTIEQSFNWLYIVGGLFLVVVAFFLIFLYRRKKDEKEEKEEQV